MGMILNPFRYAASGPPLPFSDDFNSGISGWTASPGYTLFAAASGVARASGTSNRAMYPTDYTTALYDCYVQVQVVAGGTNGDARVYARWDGDLTGTGYQARYEPGGARWELYRTVTGTTTNLANYSESQPSQPYTIRLEVEDEGSDVRLRVKLNGVTKISYLDTSGIKVTGGGGIRGRHYSMVDDLDLDNFEMGEL